MRNHAVILVSFALIGCGSAPAPKTSSGSIARTTKPAPPPAVASPDSGWGKLRFDTDGTVPGFEFPITVGLPDNGVEVSRPGQEVEAPAMADEYANLVLIQKRQFWLPVQPNQVTVLVSDADNETLVVAGGDHEPVHVREVRCGLMCPRMVPICEIGDGADHCVDELPDFEAIAAPFPYELRKLSARGTVRFEHESGTHFIAVEPGGRYTLWLYGDEEPWLAAVSHDVDKAGAPR